MGVPVIDFEPAIAYVHAASIDAATWGRRTKVSGTAEQIRAGHAAIDAIDAALRCLYDQRAALITELRRGEDVFMAQLDAFDTYASNVEAARGEVGL